METDTLATWGRFAVAGRRKPQAVSEAGDEGHGEKQEHEYDGEPFDRTVWRPVLARTSADDDQHEEWPAEGNKRHDTRAARVGPASEAQEDVSCRFHRGCGPGGAPGNERRGACRAAAISARIDSAADAAGICLRRGFGAPLELDGTVFQPALADDHAERNPDQVGVLEFEAGALVAVVGQDFEPGRGRALFRASVRARARPRSAPEAGTITTW